MQALGAQGDREAACRHLAEARKASDWLKQSAPGYPDASRMPDATAAAAKELGCD